MGNNQGDPTITWYRSPIEKAKLRELTKKSDLKGALQTFPFLLLVTASGVASVYAASHTRHHLFTLHPPEDLEVVLPIPYTIKEYLLQALINPFGLVMVVRTVGKTALGKVEGEWPTKLFPEDDRVARRQLERWARITLLGHVAIVVLFWSLHLWMIPVVLTFAPFYGSWLYFLCNNTQHVGLQDNVPDFRLCCRTFIPNPFVRFLYWRMNYHAEHHMYAAVPCYNLARLRREIESDMPEAPRGIVSTWRHIAWILKKQKEEPSYQYAAPLPPESGVAG